MVPASKMVVAVLGGAAVAQDTPGQTQALEPLNALLYAFAAGDAHKDGPPRPRPIVQSKSSPCGIPATARPMWRSSTGLQGTSVNSRDFSITAKRPLAKSTA